MNKKAIIIDTDPGIDDAVALAIGLFSEELDVKLITTVAGNVSIEKVTNNALKLLKYYGKKVPVAMGASEPLIEKFQDASEVHGVSGMDGFDFEEPTNELLLEENAINVMRRVILESETPITIVPIGPMTNIAMLLKVYPEVKANIKEIVFMGGSMSRGNRGVMSEFNIAVDPEAAQIVFSSGLKITMVGLEMGNGAVVQLEDTGKMRDINKIGFMISSLFKKYRSSTLKKGFAMYDVHAIAYLLHPEIYETKDTYIEVELNKGLTRGCTVIDLNGYLKNENNITVCTKLNEEKFKEWFIESLINCK